MKKLRILIDIDGILADTIPYWLDYIGKMTGVVAKMEDITQYDLTKCPPLSYLKPEVIFEVLQRPGFTSNVPVMEGAPNVVKNLMNDGHEVYLVTARSGGTHCAETFEWLHKHMPFIDTRKQLVFLYDKHLLHADVIIDDQAATLTNYKGLHQNALTLGIKYPYNAHLEILSDPISRDIMLVEYGDTAWTTLYQQILLHAEKP